MSAPRMDATDAWCPVCGRRVAVRRNGRLHRHNGAMGRCEATGRIVDLPRPVTLRLTATQLEALISIVEMTLDGSSVTFGDWIHATARSGLDDVETQLHQAELRLHLAEPRK